MIICLQDVDEVIKRFKLGDVDKNNSIVHVNGNGRLETWPGIYLDAKCPQ